MKIEQQFSEPEHVVDRQTYRVRIEGKDGQAIEIVEQMDGGFSIHSAWHRQLAIEPISNSTIIIKVNSK